MRYNTRWEEDGECCKDPSDIRYPGGPARFLIPGLILSSWPGEWRPCRPSPGDHITFTTKMMCPEIILYPWPDDPRYGVSGWLEDLPRLSQGRESHGCGAYTDTQGHRVREHRIMMAWDIMLPQVILVTGGWDGVSRGLDSTEILENNESGWWFIFSV